MSGDASSEPGRDAATETTARVGLFLFQCPDAASLRELIRRIPPEAGDRLSEIIVMIDRPENAFRLEADEIDDARSLVIRIHRPPFEFGFGAARKAAFEYAANGRFDQVIFMQGDGSHPPEAIVGLIREACRRPERAVLLDTVHGPDRPLSRRLSRSFSTFVQNRILGLRVDDYHTSYRLYPMSAIARMPFQLNSNDERFDSEILLQLRALQQPFGPPIEGDSIPTSSEDGSPWSRDFLIWEAAVGYRLHQMHVTRDGRYLVDRGIHYTLKHSATSSHSQIIAAIEPGSAVLDLGCATGLLARPLLEKEVRVTGVDTELDNRLSSDLEAYHRHDLETPLHLALGRRFDYVVCADVIEHIRNRRQLLRSARRYLKPEGRLVISTPNVALWFYRLSLLAGRFEYGPRGVLDETHVHLYTRSTFRREVENAGFQILNQRVTALPFEVVFESTGRSRLLRALTRFYHRLAKLWPSMFAYQFILEARISTLDDEAVTDAGGADGRT